MLWQTNGHGWRFQCIRYGHVSPFSTNFLDWLHIQPWADLESLVVCLKESNHVVGQSGVSKWVNFIAQVKANQWNDAARRLLNETFIMLLTLIREYEGLIILQPGQVKMWQKCWNPENVTSDITVFSHHLLYSGFYVKTGESAPTGNCVFNSHRERVYILPHFFLIRTTFYMIYKFWPLTLYRMEPPCIICFVVYIWLTPHTPICIWYILS